MNQALKFKHNNVPRQNGEQARLKVVQGPDYGSTYVLTGTRATIGRGDDNDVVLSDLKASRLHADLSLNAGRWMLKDMGSANGILVNNANTRQAAIRTNDIFVIGETTLEFMASNESATMMLVSPPRPASQLHNLAQKTGLPGLSGAGAAAGSLFSNPASRRRIMLIAALGVAAYFFVDGESDNAKRASAARAPAAKTGVQDLAAYLPSGENPAMNKTTDQFFRAGFREFRAGNYLRAMQHFDSVLQVSPEHQLAKLYRQNCENQIKDEVEFHLMQGKRSFDSGKLKASRGHFESVMRLLYRDQSNEKFLEARDQLKKVDEALATGGSS